MAVLSEAEIEQSALAWLEALGWCSAQGSEVAHGLPAAERRDSGQVVLAQRLRFALGVTRP